MKIDLLRAAGLLLCLALALSLASGCAAPPPLTPTPPLQTSTPILPTATSAPTGTPVPPTAIAVATSTPVPPTAMPSVTPVLPTPTSQPTVTSTRVAPTPTRCIPAFSMSADRPSYGSTYPVGTKVTLTPACFPPKEDVAIFWYVSPSQLSDGPGSILKPIALSPPRPGIAHESFEIPSRLSGQAGTYSFVMSSLQSQVRASMTLQFK